MCFVASVHTQLDFYSICVQLFQSLFSLYIILCTHITSFLIVSRKMMHRSSLSSINRLLRRRRRRGDNLLCSNRMKNDWTVIPTIIDSVYTISLLNPNFNYEEHTANASKLFRQSSRHVSPKELNYELPSNNLPEFAFIGR